MISHAPAEWAISHAMPWAARMILHMDYSLSHGHHGTMPCSPDHREAVGPVGLVVDRVLSFVITEQSPFALARGLVSGPSRAKGALAQCQTLFLNLNKIGDAGMTSLAEACAGGFLAHLT